MLARHGKKIDRLQNRQNAVRRGSGTSVTITNGIGEERWNFSFSTRSRESRVDYRYFAPLVTHQYLERKETDCFVARNCIDFTLKNADKVTEAREKNVINCNYKISDKLINFFRDSVLLRFYSRQFWLFMLASISALSDPGWRILHNCPVLEES